jgi:hypothetical protein
MPGEDGGDVLGRHAVRVHVYLLRPGWRGGHAAALRCGAGGG